MNKYLAASLIATWKLLKIPLALSGVIGFFILSMYYQTLAIILFVIAMVVIVTLIWVQLFLEALD